MGLYNHPTKTIPEPKNGELFFAGKLRISPVTPRKESFFQRFGKGVGGRGLATNRAQIRQKRIPRIVSSVSSGGDRKNGAEKRPESLAWSGREPLFETSDIIVVIIIIIIIIMSNLVLALYRQTWFCWFLDSSLLLSVRGWM